MPRGLHRYYGADQLHFITSSCYRRMPLLRSARSRDRILSVLEQTRKRYRFVVMGYVVMAGGPDHCRKGNPTSFLRNQKHRGPPLALLEKGAFRLQSSSHARAFFLSSIITFRKARLIRVW
jgi:hypothetical protein